MNSNINFYRKVFIDFLEYHNCKDEYFDNCINYPLDNEIFDYTDNHSLESFISDAFDWDDTDEGEDFWDEIDDNWRFIISMDIQDLKFNYSNIDLIKKTFCRFVKYTNSYSYLLMKKINFNSHDLELAIIFNSYDLFSELLFPSRMEIGDIENTNVIWRNIIKKIYDNYSVKRHQFTYHLQSF